MSSINYDLRKHLLKLQESNLQQIANSGLPESLEAQKCLEIRKERESFGLYTYRIRFSFEENVLVDHKDNIWKWCPRTETIFQEGDTIWDGNTAELERVISQAKKSLQKKFAHRQIRNIQVEGEPSWHNWEGEASLDLLTRAEYDEFDKRNAQSEPPTDNKQAARKLQKILKDLTYDVKLTHCYEILSRMGGFNSYNVAKAKGFDFTPPIPSKDEFEVVGEGWLFYTDGGSGAWYANTDAKTLRHFIDNDDGNPPPFRTAIPEGRIVNIYNAGSDYPNQTIRFEEFLQSIGGSPVTQKEHMIDFLLREFAQTFVFGKPINREQVTQIVTGLFNAAELNVTIPEISKKLHSSDIEIMELAKFWSEFDQPDAIWFQDYNYELVSQAVSILVRKYIV